MGDDKRYIRSVVVLSSTRPALTLKIGLNELRVRCLFVPDLNAISTLCNQPLPPIYQTIVVICLTMNLPRP